MPSQKALRKLVLYYITDRQALPGKRLEPFLRRAVASGIDMIQIREKDLESKDLLSLVRLAVSIASGSGTAGLPHGGRMNSIVPPVKVKVCCIASPEEAETAVSYGVAAIGMVDETPTGEGRFE